MRRTMLFLALLCGPALAAQDVPMVLKCNGAVTQTVTVAASGYVKEILVSSPTTNGTVITSVTGAVDVVAIPAVGYGNANVVLYTNSAVSASVKARPRYAPTSNTGATLATNTVDEAYLSVGDSLRLRVLQNGATTNVLWRVDVKMDDVP